jgi:hypothetical protein
MTNILESTVGRWVAKLLLAKKRMASYPRSPQQSSTMPDAAIQRLVLRRLYDGARDQWSPMQAQFPISGEEQLGACQQLSSSGLIELSWISGEPLVKITSLGIRVVEGTVDMPVLPSSMPKPK